MHFISIIHTNHFLFTFLFPGANSTDKFSTIDIRGTLQGTADGLYHKKQFTIRFSMTTMKGLWVMVNAGKLGACLVRGKSGHEVAMIFQCPSLITLFPCCKDVSNRVNMYVIMCFICIIVRCTFVQCYECFQRFPFSFTWTIRTFENTIDLILC